MLVESKSVITSSDVARIANVSQATVSRVFNNPDKVKAQTVAKVQKAVRDLGYTPNAIARSLTSKQTNMVAIVSVRFDNPFYQTLLIKISDMISEMGKKVILIQTNFDQSLDDILHEVMAYQVDGVVVLSAALSTKLLDRFAKIQIPLVVFNKYFDSREFFSVSSDNMDAGKLVADFLHGRGYKSFGFISGLQLSQTSDFRYKGFTERLHEHGYVPPVSISGDYSYRSGYEGLLEMKQRGKLPQAVFCVNDLMALGAMDAARSVLGMKIPDDIAFVGFDNLEQGSWQSYKLTSVKQPLDEMISHTQNYLTKKFDNAETSGGYILLKCKLEERSSS
ncbi:MAG: LacI family DNA-binding transcriptional regulator [Oscillospiraceae bacterium]|nr:LacI family DNA-binding transcriptional regulator [Oscillospiraceae bacterium]